MSDDLLSIDVSSELQTLCESQLRGRWQVPAELVRLSSRLGADAVSVARHRRGIVVSWNGPRIDYEVIADLAIALDETKNPSDRQRAIAAIETSGMEALLWAAGLRGARLRVTVSGRQGGWRFEHVRRQSRLRRDKRCQDPTEVEITWWCPGLDRRRAMRWLAVAVRFSPCRVSIDGAQGPHGFAGGLFHLGIEDPVPCRLGLTRSGDDPVLWLLRDGVISARATVPGYPPFEAAVELRDRVAPGASAADMRRAVTPYLEALIERAVWMMVEVTGRRSVLTTCDHERLCLLVLRACRKGIRASEIRRLGLVRTAAEDRLLSIEEICGLADRSGGVLAAVDHGQRRGEDLVDPGSNLVASREIRDLLTELIGVRFQSPSRRRRRRWSRFVDGFCDCVGHLRRRARGLFADRGLMVDELRSQEILTLEAMRTALSPLAVDLCRGRGLVGSTGRRLVVPRSGPAMAAGADLVAAETAWLYPLLLALDIGNEPPEDLRARWLEASNDFSEQD